MALSFASSSVPLFTPRRPKLQHDQEKRMAARRFPGTMEGRTQCHARIGLMVTTPAGVILGHFRKLPGDQRVGPLPDDELLRRFSAGRGGGELSPPGLRPWAAVPGVLGPLSAQQHWRQG